MLQVGLKEKFPQYNFPVLGVDVAAGSSFGLQADADPLWTKDRETQSHQVGYEQSVRAGACKQHALCMR